MRVQIHHTFRHDCSSFPEGFARPGLFVNGTEHEVPDDVGDYFLRAGWASSPGEQPIKVDKTTPVYVDVRSSKLKTGGN